MKEDVEQVLRFMASNGLVANPAKTMHMILKHKAQVPVEMQEISSKLLGVYINESKNRAVKGEVISCLNQRLFLVRRLKNNVG